MVRTEYGTRYRTVQFIFTFLHSDSSVSEDEEIYPVPGTVWTFEVADALTTRLELTYYVTRIFYAIF